MSNIVVVLCLICRKEATRLSRVRAMVYLYVNSLRPRVSTPFFARNDDSLIRPPAAADSMPKVHLLPGQLDHGRTRDVSRRCVLWHRRTVVADFMRRGLFLSRARAKHNVGIMPGLVLLPGGHVVADREHLRDWRFLRGRECGAHAVHARLFLQYERTVGSNGSVPGGQGNANNVSV